MASLNPFDLLGDDDNDDPSLLLAAQQQKVAAVAAATKKAVPVAAGQGAKQAKFPTKPLPPSQAVKEARNEGGRGGGRGGGGRGYGRGRGGPGGYNRDSDENTFGNGNGLPVKPSEDRESGKYQERRPYSGARGGYRGGRRDGEGGEGERPRRTYDRRSGSGHGAEFKRDGAGRGNWGTPTDEILQETGEPIAENETNAAVEKKNDEENADANKENPAVESEEKEPEEIQMTLEEYEKVLEEKRKALQTMKVEERKVDTKVFESMQMMSKKKDNDEIFIKLGSDKDKRSKEAADKEERAKKSVSINEFLKPAEGESYYRPGGRGRGRGGRGPRGGGYGGGQGGGRGYDAPAPPIADPGHFPSLGGK